MQTFFEVDADQIEAGDQILIDGDPVEITKVEDNLDDEHMIRLTGYSHDTGDVVCHEVYFSKSFEVWGV